MTRLGRQTLAAVLGTAVLTLVGCSGPTADAEDAPTSASAAPATEAAPTGDVELPAYEREPGVVTQADADPPGDPAQNWAQATAVEPILVTSSLDGSQQPSLYAPPAEENGALLVVVHSWSADHLQDTNIPSARWAEQIGWGYLQPEFRGINDDPDATGSDLAVQDVVDAVQVAVDSGDVDPDRVYVSGFSGGGMMSLLLAGRHADTFAGAVSWVPIHDLATWYAYNRDVQPDRAYAGQIVASCGGDPSVPGAAADSCAARSPSSVLQGAAQAGVPVYLGAGIGDDVVPASETLRAFDELADPADRVGEGAIAAASRAELDPALLGQDEARTWFTDADPEVLFSRQSGATTVVVFDGGHDLVYYPGLDWLAALDVSR